MTTTTSPMVEKGRVSALSSTRSRAWRCYPGGASQVVAIAEADAALDAYSEPLGYAGVSAGALVALARAFGVASKDIRVVVDALVEHNRVLDFAPFQIGDGGLCAWRVVPAAIDELIGKGKKLGEAKKRVVVVVTDLDAGAPVYVDSANPAHADILVRELAAATSAIPGVAPQLAIPSWAAGKYSPGIKLFSDGGVTDNTADHVFDDDVAPRIALQLAGGNALPTRVRHGDPLTQALAVFRSMLWASSSRKSRRRDGVDVVVGTHGSGFNFNVGSEERAKRRALARAAVLARSRDLLALKGGA